MYENLKIHIDTVGRSKMLVYLKVNSSETKHRKSENCHSSSKALRHFDAGVKEPSHLQKDEALKPIYYISLLSKSLQAVNAGEGVEKREPSYTVGGNAN